MTYIYCSAGFIITTKNLCFNTSKIDWIFTVKKRFYPILSGAVILFSNGLFATYTFYCW